MRAAKSRLFLLLAIALLLLASASPVNAATWESVNYTEDYVDATSNLHLATPDLGTHSVFGDLQDYGANYDQMLEENTGAAGNDVEQFVQAQTNAGDPTDIGTHAGGGFAEMQDKDGIFDLLTEVNTGGAGGTTEYIAEAFTDVGGDFASENLAYDGDWATYATDTAFSNADDYPSAYASSFDSVNSGTGTITQVDIILRMEYISSGVSDTWGITLDVSASTNNELRAHDGNAYALNNLTFTDVSEPNDASWSWADVWAAQVHIDGEKVGGADSDTFNAYEFSFKVTVSGSDVFDMDLEVGWTTADFDETTGEELCIFGGTMATELLRVDVWTGAWTNLDTDLVAGWNNISVTAYLIDATFEIRFTDTTDDAVVADDWEIEGVLLHCWTDGTTNYELDLEIGWSTADNDESQESLCIYPVTGGGWPAEAIKVDIWDGAWTNLWADLTPDQWNNISISSYLTGAAVEVRFLGGTETGDTGQDTWEIDAVLIQTWSYAYTETMYEAMGVADTDFTSLDASREFFESVGLADSVATAVTTVKTMFESVGIADSMETVFTAVRTFYEAIGHADSVATVASFVLALFESLGVASVVLASKLIQQFLYESVGLADTVFVVFTASRTMYESVGIAEAELFVLTLSRTFFESVGLADAELVGASFVRIFFDAIGLADTVDNQLVIQQILYEAVGVAAVATTVYSASRTLGENLGIADSLLNTLTLSRTFFEEIGISDVATNSMAAAKTFFESIGLADIAAPTFIPGGGDDYEQYLFESIGLADSIATVLVASRTFYEVIGIADDVAMQFTGLWHLYLFEAFRFLENDVWAPYRPDAGGGSAHQPPLPSRPPPLIDTVLAAPSWMWFVFGLAVVGLSVYRVYVIREEKVTDFWYLTMMGNWSVRVEQAVAKIERWIEEFFGVD